VRGFIEHFAVPRDLPQEKVALLDALPHHVGGAGQQIDGEAWGEIDLAQYLSGLVGVVALKGQDDEQVDVGVLGGRAVGVGAENVWREGSDGRPRDYVGAVERARVGALAPGTR